MLSKILNTLNVPKTISVKNSKKYSSPYYKKTKL